MFFRKKDKFIVCNDEHIKKAVTKACIASKGFLQEATYVICSGHLIVAFINPENISIFQYAFMDAIDTLKNSLHNSYKYCIDIWDYEKFVKEVPYDIRKQTGYVNITNF